jgi:pimeloyl-ACP methyl ester carboxylesterase
MTPPVTEGFVRFRGMRTWYRIVGDLHHPAAGRLPLLLLHGGPGTPSDMFEPLEVLAQAGRPIIRYDQLGCGRSDRPDDPSLWTIQTFVDELGTVRQALGLDRVHLLGASWGGQLALAYLVTRPTGIASLVLASTPCNTRLYLEEARRLWAQLPAYAQLAMRRLNDKRDRPKAPTSTGKVGKGLSTRAAQRRAVVLRAAYGVLAKPAVLRLAAWAAAVPLLRRAAYPVAGVEWMRRHIIRTPPRQVPLSFFRAMAGSSSQVHETMTGPTGFYEAGTLQGWDATERLGEITVPTLITSGHYDHLTPRQMRVLHEEIPGSRWVVFEHSAHAALYEEPDRYRAVLEAFLQSAESGAVHPQ